MCSTNSEVANYRNSITCKHKQLQSVDRTHTKYKQNYLRIYLYKSLGHLTIKII